MQTSCDDSTKVHVSFREAVLIWVKIGFLSFGGPAAQIALMHRMIVDEKKWIDEDRFLHALNYCMLLPGPEAQQLATYIGWLLHGVRGGFVAGLLFVLPGAIVIFLLSCLYVFVGHLEITAGIFFGLKAAVLAIVSRALIQIATRTLKGVFKPVLAILGFLVLFIFDISFPIVILAGGMIGYIFAIVVKRGTNHDVISAGEELNAQTISNAHRAALVCLLLWVLRVFGLLSFLGYENVFTQIAVFFSKMAIVTFGGAYAALAYVAQTTVQDFKWLTADEMIEILALAETTPGPLILVTQFVGFLAAYRKSGLEPNVLAGAFGGFLTTWVIFLPSFLWIFAGAPYVEKLRRNLPLSGAFEAIRAAVVGVIANLALWFAIHVLFAKQYRITNSLVNMTLPELSSVHWTLLLLTVFAFFSIFVLRLKILYLLAICAFLGVIL
jgi:chromate transporter